jgi:hypothetical protein
MIIDFTQKEWQSNYLAFKDAGNVPAALTQLQTTADQNTALGRRYWNPLGECFIYVYCDYTRGGIESATTAISITAASKCYVEDVGYVDSGTPANNRPLYNVFASNGATTPQYNAYSLYAIASSSTAGKVWGLVKFLPCGIV